MSELPDNELESGLRAAFDGPLPDASVLKQLDAKPLRLGDAVATSATNTASSSASWPLKL